ncbi:hypothetical protein [Micrococcus luteus]|uniref:hypothetical protein n=1 Tax=Micrococcus luteus TaxID=1270 RepID=UPI003F6E2946
MINAHQLLSMTTPTQLPLLVVEAGSIADWISGIATAAAVGVALFANRITAKERDDAKKDRDEASEDREMYREELDLTRHDRRAELARKILFKVTPQDETPTSVSNENSPKKSIRLSVTNYSEFPIYNIRIGHNRTPYEIQPVVSEDSLGPGETFSFDYKEGKGSPNPLLVAGFHDVRGRGWILDRFGHLLVGDNRVDFIKLYDRKTNPFPD